MTNQRKQLQPQEIGVDDLMIDATSCARLLKLTKRRVNQLSVDGWIAKVERGRYRIFDVVQGYIRFLKHDARRTSKSAGDNAVREARATEIRLRTARQERELVPTEEAASFVNLVIGHLISRMAGLPAQHTRDLDERRRLESAIDDIRQEVVGLVEKHGAALCGHRNLAAAGKA